MPGSADFIRAFGAHLEGCLESLAAEIVEETYRSVPGYQDVPRDDFLQATRETLAFVAVTFRQGRIPGDDEFAFDAETVRRRVRQGVRAKDWVAHARTFLGLTRDAAVGFGEETGVAEAEVLGGIVAMDEAARANVAFAGQEFERAADELMREDEAQRREFISKLLRGELPPGAMRSGVAAIGLDPGAVYRAVRIRAFEARASPDLLRRILRQEPTIRPRGAWASVDEDISGITQDGLAVELDDAAAGIGPAVPLEAVASSYAVASAALETARAFRLAGAHRIEDLGALPMVAAAGRAGDALVERFVDGVERAGPSGRALVDTVSAYFGCGLQAGATARSLHLHPNSLRKRLRRYEELTGADMSSMDDLAAVWSALKRREMESRAPAPA